MIKIYHNKRCNISRKVLDTLKELFPNEKINIRYYLEEPLTYFELKTLFNQLNIPIQEAIRKNEKLFKDNYKGEILTDEEWIKIIEKNPILLQRPIVIKDNKAFICRPPERIQELAQP